ncbi:unnamed protein product [Effrenium voratum]|nr:unnamed protein product [Effrenium voratum]
MHHPGSPAASILNAGDDRLLVVHNTFLDIRADERSGHRPRRRYTWSGVLERLQQDLQITPRGPQAQTPPEPGRYPPSTDNSESSGSDQGTEQEAEEAEEADNVEALPSVGSYNHMAGTCNPCRFVQGRRGVLGCRIGFHCNYCHMCHAPVEQPTSRPRKKVREGYKASILAIRDSDQSAAAKRKAIQQLKEKGAYARGLLRAYLPEWMDELGEGNSSASGSSWALDGQPLELARVPGLQPSSSSS